MRIYVQGGNGGTGCFGFSRENHNSRVPDGGNGGDGGSVYFKASGAVTSLYGLHKAHFKGNNGKLGAGKKRNGLNGKDIR